MERPDLIDKVRMLFSKETKDDYKDGEVYRTEEWYCINAKVVNALGIHARPSALLVKKAMWYKSDVRIIYSKEEVSAKSIMGLMMLAAEKGADLVIKAKGEDAEEAVKDLYTTIKSFVNEDLLR